MTHKLKTAFVGIILLIAFTMLRVYDPYPIETLRLKGLDYYQRTQPKVISDNIQIIEIDEQTLEQNGQWPWI